MKALAPVLVVFAIVGVVVFRSYFTQTGWQTIGEETAEVPAGQLESLGSWPLKDEAEIRIEIGEREDRSFVMVLMDEENRERLIGVFEAPEERQAELFAEVERVVTESQDGKAVNHLRMGPGTYHLFIEPTGSEDLVVDYRIEMRPPQ